MTLLDTNVLSELMKANPAAPLVAWVGKQSASELSTSAITEAEIFYAIEMLPKGKRRGGLLAAAEAMFTEDFAGRVYGFESAAAREFSKIVAYRRKLGRPINHADAQVAAIARVRNAKLATRNATDFAECGIDVIDPWSV